MLQTAAPYRFSTAIAILCAVVLAGVKINNNQNNILSYDTFGYYMYLPARFIFDDPGLKDFSRVENINRQYKNSNTLYQFASGTDGQKVIRFYRGISYLIAPGFFAGHIYAKITGEPTDGFSKPYQDAIIYWNLIFNLLGLFFAWKILLYYFPDRVAAMTLPLLFLVSNLYAFIGYSSEIPHVYLFTLIAALIWFTIRWHAKPGWLYAAAIGLTGGLIAVSRPSEILVMLIPLLWGICDQSSLAEKWKTIIRHWPHLIVMTFALMLPVIPQLMYWKTVSGSYFFQSYTDPGSTLDLTNPRILYTLFGFRKGWFIYSPVMLFAIYGLYRAIRQKTPYALAVVVYLALNLYLIASFSSLVSYGWRAFLQSYAALILPMGLFTAWALQQNKIIRTVLLVVVLFLAYVNFFQAWQIHQGIIHGSRMTRPYYFAAFLRSKIKPEDQNLLRRDLYQTFLPSVTEDFFNRVVRFNDYETPEARLKIDSAFAFSGKYALRIDSLPEYPAGFSARYGELTDRKWVWVRMSARIYPLSMESNARLSLVVHCVRKEQTHKYQLRDIGDVSLGVKPGQWNYVFMEYQTPEVISPDDLIKAYLWNRGKDVIFIDDFRVEVFEPADDGN
jgi:hypothetical protein